MPENASEFTLPGVPYRAVLWIVAAVMLAGCQHQTSAEPGDGGYIDISREKDKADANLTDASAKPAVSDGATPTTGDAQSVFDRLALGPGVHPPDRAPGELVPVWDPGDPPSPGGERVGWDVLDKPVTPPPEAKGLLQIPDPKHKDKHFDAWVDAKNKRIVLGGRIVKRTGPMELFACLARTKEHESIVSVRTAAYPIHAFLLAMKVAPGKSVRFFPEYLPATGPVIEITVHWTDKEGRRRWAPASDWLQDVTTGKALSHPWVFGGSGFWVSDDMKERFYLAEDGDFICVSNFHSAMFDLPIASSQANSALLYHAFTERIPPVGTEVAIILTSTDRRYRDALVAPWPRLDPLIAPPPK